MATKKSAQRVAKNSLSKTTTKSTAVPSATKTGSIFTSDTTMSIGTKYVDPKIISAVSNTTKLSNIIPKVKNNGAYSVSGHSHTGTVSARTYLTSTGTNVTWKPAISEPFTDFKEILGGFGLKYKYSPKSTEQTWGLKVGDNTIYYNRGWFYFDGTKTKEQSEAISHLLKALGMDLEESLWQIGK